MSLSPEHLAAVQAHSKALRTYTQRLRWVNSAEERDLHLSIRKGARTLLARADQAVALSALLMGRWAK